jgi:hypothetical protein
VVWCGMVVTASYLLVLEYGVRSEQRLVRIVEGTTPGPALSGRLACPEYNDDLMCGACVVGVGVCVRDEIIIRYPFCICLGTGVQRVQRSGKVDGGGGVFRGL